MFVGVAEGQARAVGRVDDSAIGDTEVVQVALPLLELRPVGTRESQMVQARVAPASRTPSGFAGRTSSETRPSTTSIS